MPPRPGRSTTAASRTGSSPRSATPTGCTPTGSSAGPPSAAPRPRWARSGTPPGRSSALVDVTSEDTTANAERVVRDIPIHGGVNNWYIDVVDPPRSYRIDIGYLSAPGPLLRAGPLQRRDHPPGRLRRPARRALGERRRALPDDLQAVAQRRLGLPRPPGDLRGAAPPADGPAEPHEPRHRRPARRQRQPRLPLRDRRRADRLRHDRAERQGHAPGRAGEAPPRRLLQRPLQPCPRTARSSRPSPPAPTASRSGRSSWPSSATPRNSSR